MTAIYFDTYKVITILNRKGFTTEQSEAVVEALQEVNLDHLASRADLAELKSDLFKWFVPLIGGLYALIFGLYALVVFKLGAV